MFIGLAQGPATLDELAATCGIPRRTAGISADAMVSLGLLQRDGERYRNGETAAAFLAGRPGLDLRPMLRFWNRISYPGWLAALRAKMETEWTPQMMAVLGIDRRSLPIIWDADFLYGPQTASGEDSYILCAPTRSA